MDSSTEELTAKYQWTIANRLSTMCPAASRFYMSNLEKSLIDDPKLLKKDVKRSFLYCNRCGSLWQPGNHHIRVCAPPVKNNHIKKLLKYEAEQPWKLNNRQKKKLKKFMESTSKIVYTCHICKKTTTFPGIKKQNRDAKKVSFNTPVPKIRSKKGDLNAGLFIKIPSDKSKEEKIQEQPSSKQLPISETQELNKIESSKPTAKIMNKRPITTPKLSMSNTIVKSSNKKRKKDLLTQILNQEQESKKRKNNLSSFLISL